MKRILGVLLTVLAVLLSGVQAGMVAARTVGRQAAGALEGLLRTAAWQQFKAFWRRIGLIPPKRPATDGTRRLAISDAPYAHVIGKEEHDRLGKELGDRLAALSAAGFPKDDLDFLEQVVRARLGNMLHGPTSMLTRMVPSANMIEEEKSLQQVERQIDLLDTLRRAGKITTTEFRVALNGVQRELCNISITRMVAALYGRFWPVLDREWHEKFRTMELVERQLWIIGNHYRTAVDRYSKMSGGYAVKQKAELERKYRNVTGELDTFRKRMPRIHHLIEELER